MKISLFIKKIISLIFRKRIAELKANKIADSYTIKTVTSGVHGPGTASSLQSMKDCGIKKVELVCWQKCECCKDLFNKQLLIDKVPDLPRTDCPLYKCNGRYAAIVEFD